MKIIEILKKLIELYKQLLAKKKEELKDFEAFALAVRNRESSNNYQAVNSLGYLGAYQFGLARLCDLGYTKRKPNTTGYGHENFEWVNPYTQEMFLTDNELQDKIFKEHVDNLKSRLLKLYKDKLDYKITISGLVMGAHLGGIGSVKKFFDNEDVSDAYGTSVGEYIRQFSGYNI